MKSILLLMGMLFSLNTFAMSSGPSEKPEIDPSPDALNCGTDAAKAECLKPKFSDQYYIDQSVKYFLTMQSDVSVFVQPNYSTDVVRWEWEPWLLLTGYGRFNLYWTDALLKLYPTAYAMMDCRAFDTQPFGRCHVVFDYSGHLCPIYEEFTFNDQGEITFIEAWTDYPSLIPMAPNDYWAEGDDVDRLSTKTPGLGNETGLIDPYADWMDDAAKEDADVKDMVSRMKRPYIAYFSELIQNYDDVLEGCDPPQ